MGLWRSGGREPRGVCLRVLEKFEVRREALGSQVGGLYGAGGGDGGKESLVGVQVLHVARDVGDQVSVLRVAPGTRRSQRRAFGQGQIERARGGPGGVKTIN